MVLRRAGAPIHAQRFAQGLGGLHLACKFFCGWATARMCPSCVAAARHPAPRAGGTPWRPCAQPQQLLSRATPPPCTHVRCAPQGGTSCNRRAWERRVPGRRECLPLGPAPAVAAVGGLTQGSSDGAGAGEERPEAESTRAPTYQCLLAPLGRLPGSYGWRP